MIIEIYSKKAIPNLLSLESMTTGYYIKIIGDEVSNGYYLCIIDKKSGKIILPSHLSDCGAVKAGTDGKLQII